MPIVSEFNEDRYTVLKHAPPISYAFDDENFL
jgi:hypothetical protein